MKGQGRSDEPNRSGLGLCSKTTLLNLGIVLSALPIAALAGGPEAIVPAVAPVAILSIAVWSATFAISAFVALSRIFWGLGLWGPRRSPRHPAGLGGVGDEWLDGPA